MARLVILEHGEEYKGANGRTGEVFEGVELWALSVGAPPRPFKIPAVKQKLFPRLSAVYDVEYGEVVGRFGPQAVMLNAVYVGPWSVEAGCSVGVAD